LEPDYAKALEKPVAVSPEFYHRPLPRFNHGSVLRRQLARKWMVATGTNPSIIAQKPNDDTIRKSCTLSRTFARV
jgi:hypothetical protein